MPMKLRFPFLKNALHLPTSFRTTNWHKRLVYIRESVDSDGTDTP